MNLLSQNTKATIVALASLTLEAASGYSLDFDQNITPDVIFGSGNDNGSFTTDRANGVEIGLRGKLRFNASNDPENTFNSNGDGTYSFATGTPPTGFSWIPNAPTTPIWNFDWSVNTNYDGTGAVLNAFTYLIGIDFDPSLATDFLEFDPIKGFNQATSSVQWDHGIGTNATANGGGTSISNNTSDASGYETLLNNNNVAQNSWSMEFFNTGPYSSFDPKVDGTYSIYIAAFDGGNEIARSEIQIIAGEGGAPVPDAGSAAAMLGAGLFALLGLRRFAKRS